MSRESGAIHTEPKVGRYTVRGVIEARETALGLRNTNTFPNITSTSPISAGAVHWYPSANADTFKATTGNSTVQYELAVFSAESPDLAAAQGTFTHCCVRRATQRPTPIPDDLRTTLDAVVRKRQRDAA